MILPDLSKVNIGIFVGTKSGRIYTLLSAISIKIDPPGAKDYITSDDEI
jgi:hypothetical protein